MYILVPCRPEGDSRSFDAEVRDGYELPGLGAGN